MPDSTGETAVFDNSAIPTTIETTSGLNIGGVRFDATAPARTIDVGAAFNVFAGIVNNSANIQTFNLVGSAGTASLGLAGGDVTGTQTDIIVGTNSFLQIAFTANATSANAIINGGILSVETTDGTAVLGGLSGTGTVRGAIQNGAVASQELTVGGLNLSSTFGGIFQDAFGATLSIVKVGTGTLTLTGASGNAGTTTISGGTLQIGNGGTTGSLGSGNVIDNATLAFNRSNSLTFANAISGVGKVTQNGAGTLTLSGANNYLGGTTINAGTVLLGNASGVGSGAVTFAGNGTLGTASGISGTVNGVTINAGVNATIGAAAGQTLALTGTFSHNTAPNTTVHFGSGSLTGTVDFNFSSATIGETGGAFIDAGTLRLDNGLAALYFLNNNGGLTIASGATLDINGQIGASVNLSGGGTITNNGGSAAQFQALQSAPTTFGGTIQDGTSATSLLVRGEGTLTLTGANTYSGATTFSGGSTLQIGNGGATGSIGNTDIDLTNGHLVIDSVGAISLTGTISGTADLTQAGSGVTTVTGANTYSGATNLNLGTLEVGNTDALGTGTLTFAGGGAATTLRGITTASLGNGLSFTNGANATIAAAAGTTLTLNGGAFSISATAPGTQIHFGSAGDTGTVVFNPSIGVVVGGSGYDILVDGGTLQAGPINTLTFMTGLSNVNTTVAAGATLDYTPFGSGRINNLLGAGTVVDDGGTTSIVNGLFSGSLTGTQNVSAVSGGTVILTGANDYAGTTTFSGNSTLQIGNGGTTGSIGNTDIDLTNGHLVVNRAGALTLSGTISGTGDITLAGPGTTTFTGVNTYTGGTNLNQGVAEAGNTDALGTGTLTFAGGGAATTLRGITTASLGNSLSFTNGANATIAAAAGTTLTLNGGAFSIGATAPGTQIHFGSAGDTGTVVFNPSIGVVVGGSGYDILVDGGTLQAGPINTLTFMTGLSNVNTTVAAGATLDYTPFGSGRINNLLGAGTAARPRS